MTTVLWTREDLATVTGRLGTVGGQWNHYSLLRIGVFEAVLSFENRNPSPFTVHKQTWKNELLLKNWVSSAIMIYKYIISFKISLAHVKEKKLTHLTMIFQESMSLINIYLHKSNKWFTNISIFLPSAFLTRYTALILQEFSGNMNRLNSSYSLNSLADCSLVLITDTLLFSLSDQCSITECLTKVFIHLFHTLNFVLINSQMR